MERGDGGGYYIRKYTVLYIGLCCRVNSVILGNFCQHILFPPEFPLMNSHLLSYQSSSMVIWHSPLSFISTTEIIFGTEAALPLKETQIVCNLATRSTCAQFNYPFISCYSVAAGSGAIEATGDSTHLAQSADYRRKPSLSLGLCTI